ncbi:hypothetical protein [Cryobacterium roopkundense]|nr:hypothetical protein [Cryobacterium roopkundense]
MVAANGDAVRRQAHAAALTFALSMKTLDIAWDDAISLAAAAYANA